MTFTPCFLFVLVGAPYAEHLRGRRGAQAALAAITAAVVGVILNLAVWFSTHTVFARVRTLDTGPLDLQIPEWASADPMALALTGGALVAMLRFKIGMITTLGVAAAVGLGWHLVGGG